MSTAVRERQGVIGQLAAAMEHADQANAACEQLAGLTLLQIADRLRAAALARREADRLWARYCATFSL
jgi:hypothetical protein